MGELNTPSDEVMKKCKEAAYDRLVEARKIKSKKERNDAVDAIKGEVIKTHFSIPAGIPYSDHIEAEKKQKQAKEALRLLEKKVTHYLVAQHSIRADGRKLHPCYLFEVKQPSESRGAWDYYKLLGTTDAANAFRPIGEGGCALVRS
jgi:polyribonucleotide nucleotidyltransferase